MTRTLSDLQAALERGSGHEAYSDEDTAYLEGVLGEIAALGHAATPAFAAVAQRVANNMVKYAALDALRAMIPELVAKGLVEMVRDPAARKAALGVIEELRGEGEYVDAIVVALRDIPDVIPLLLDLLENDTDGFRRSDVPRALGVIGAGDDRVLAAFVKAATDDDNWVRQWTAHGLIHFGDRAIPTLERLSRDFGEADEAAVYALSQIATPAAIAALDKIARTSKGLIRARAKDAAGTIRARQAREKPAKKARPAAKTARKPTPKTKAKPEPKAKAKPKAKPKPKAKAKAKPKAKAKAKR